jgi:SAM-dependent methyltransferase
MISLWIRNLVTDSALKRLRKQLIELIPTQSQVIDIGCANGRLLFDLSDRINRGLGIDLDEKMIHYAQKKAKTSQKSNLEFQIENAVNLADNLPFFPSLTICSLCLHEMETSLAIQILRKYSDLSGTIVIVDLFEPKAWFQRQLLHLDEWMAGHHHRFQAYLDNGGMPGLIDRAKLEISKELETKISGIRIWVCGIGFNSQH